MDSATATATHAALVRAIHQRHRLRFVYHGKPRLVEPQCYGIGTQGTQLLRVHQLRGGAQRKPLFDVAQIEQLQVLDEVFERPGPHYRKDDSAMRKIFAQL